MSWCATTPECHPGSYLPWAKPPLTDYAETKGYLPWAKPPLTDYAETKGYLPVRCPQPPRKAQWCTAPVASPPVAGFTLFGGLAVFQFASRGRIGFTFVTAHRFASRGFAKRIAPLHARSATC